jgi:DHA2 family multidrug resistance protein
VSEAPTAPAPGPVEPDEWKPPFNPWLTAIVATLATFMEVLDTTIVNVSLPHIAGNLGADVDESTYVITSYLVSNAIVLPVSAWVASLVGRRNFYLMCIALFTFSSFMCGMAPGLGVLVLFRLIQGIGGGGLQPTTQAILVDTFPPRQRGMSMALFGMTVIAAPVIGPTFGGWITDHYSWRWVFLINVPVGIVAGLLCSRMIVDPPHFVRRRGKDKFRVDLIGLGLISTSIGTMQAMLDLGERRDWFESKLIVALGVTSVVTMVVGLVWELRHKDPIVNLRLLRDRNFGTSVLVMLIFGCGLYTSTALLPMYMQTLMGYPAMVSGLAISPGSLVVMALMPLIGWMATRYDARYMIAFGMGVIAYSMFLMGYFNPLAGFWTIAGARIVQSFGLAFVFVPVNTLAYAFIGREHRGSAAGLINLARNSGASIGIAVTTAMVTRRTQAHQAYLVEHVTPYDPAAMQTLHQMTATFLERFGDPVRAASAARHALGEIVAQQARALAFVDAFRYVALLMLVVVPLVFVMKRPPTIPASDTPAH